MEQIKNVVKKPKVMISGNPIDDAQGYIQYMDSIEEEQETVWCDYDHQVHLKENCVFDSKGNCWIARKNVTNYLKNFKRDMCSEEFNQLETELLNQLS